MILFIEDKNEKVGVHTDQNGIQVYRQHCKNFLNDLCIRYGSTYDGRRKAACCYLQIRQKVPIWIHEELMLFPTCASGLLKGIWINYCAVMKAEALAYRTRFVFYDQSELIVAMDHRSAVLQMRRCAHYMYAKTLYAQSMYAMIS